VLRVEHGRECAHVYAVCEDKGAGLWGDRPYPLLPGRGSPTCACACACAYACACVCTCPDVSLAVVDLGEPEAAAAAVLRRACTTHGFCYLVGHGVEAAQVAAVLAAAKAFFDLPLEAKLACAANHASRGYTRMEEEVRLRVFVQCSTDPPHTHTHTPPPPTPDGPWVSGTAESAFVHPPTHTHIPFPTSSSIHHPPLCLLPCLRPLPLFAPPPCPRAMRRRRC
jgi:hypothetical protein